MLMGEMLRIFLAATLISIVLFGFGALRNHSVTHWYLFWNLGLAWIPLLCSIWLVVRLPYNRWSRWPQVAISALWLGFLPNTFYMLTDYLHLEDVPRVDHTFDILMFTSFIMTGVALGFASLMLVHREFQKRLTTNWSTGLVTLILFVSSYAIYMGRELRWNSWDIVANPFGILFDISEQIIHPFSHPQAYIITLSYFVVLLFVYYCLWRLLQAIRRMIV